MAHGTSSFSLDEGYSAAFALCGTSEGITDVLKQMRVVRALLDKADISFQIDRLYHEDDNQDPST